MGNKVGGIQIQAKDAVMILTDNAYQYRLEFVDDKYIIYEGDLPMYTEVFETPDSISIKFTANILNMWKLKRHPIHKQFKNPLCVMLGVFLGD